ncbi:VOC family protein [Streptomyces sp. NBC_00847]|uniref:VOC family protein n=1 Tax=unclassified Streptomyces TaxID=2593676 RepID=UPI0022566EC4|nr:VOC family protein [Streptomyces sp. NBC_00847]MCX4883006.1 VOC family protein [Streptomyces sp. NBC_00847]
MLADTPLTAVIPAGDLERAKRFYGDTLGLKLIDDREGVVVFDSGGTRFSLYPTPSGGRAAHTLAAWTVGDLDAEMAELRARGVTFEEYDQPGLKTVDGVLEASGMRGAWFKDSEGNILSVVQDLR